MTVLTRDQALLLALCKIKGANWHLLAREAQRPGGLERLAQGETTETSAEARAASEAVRAARPNLDDLLDEAHAEYNSARDSDAHLVTVVDDGYPQTLRLIFNLPPFLFVRGRLMQQDVVSVAVVGTRKASPRGLHRSDLMARRLAQHGVTVVSGLARGIDTAAHTAALEEGGRTIAVVGTGIRRCYPAENRALADRITRAGAIVSQFWPDAHPATYTFPRRNVTMSGIAQGTVVIEASSTSGAKMQARIALEHGKKVFLIRSLTHNQPWASQYVAERGAIAVDDVDDVMRYLARADRIRALDATRAQLALEF